MGAVFREATFAFAQSWPSRRLPCLAALAGTQEGKTAWPWQLPARKEPTGVREKPLPCRDPPAATLVSPDSLGFLSLSPAGSGGGGEGDVSPEGQKPWVLVWALLCDLEQITPAF